MNIDKAYLQEYIKRILDERKSGGKINWRWGELREHVFGKKDANASDDLSGKNREKMIQTAIVTVSGIILAVIYLFITQPAWINCFRYRHELEEAETTLEKLQDKLSDLQKARRLYDEIHEEVAIIDEAIPDTSDIGLVLQIIGRIAGEVIGDGGKMIIQTINADMIPDDDAQTAARNSQAGNMLMEREASLTIKLLGNFQAVREFVTKIKSNRHNFRIEQIQFAPTTNTSDLLDVTVYLTYYYYN